MGPVTDKQRGKETEMDGRREAGKGGNRNQVGEEGFSVSGQSSLRSQISSLQIEFTSGSSQFALPTCHPLRWWWWWWWRLL